MSDGLQDVISAAIEGAERKVVAEAPGRPTPQLRAVEMGRVEGRVAEPAAPATVKASPPNDADQLGRGGLRLAFWLCGFHDAFMERRRRGERLTEHEESLLALSRKDFANIRSLVIKMALERLHAVVNAPDVVAEAEAGASRGKHPGMMEAFALDTLRSLSRRSLQLLHESGPSAAFSLFSEDADVQEPLAIFQLVFTTALGLVESFERLAPSDSKLLARIAEALGSEVEGI